DTAGIPCDRRNLCWRAVEAFAAATDRAISVKIHLEKRIPAAAGLGGGSSDCAAVLLELRRLFAPEMPLATLVKIALSLGADVPYFLSPKPAFCRGVGEVVEQTWEATAHPDLLLVNPSFPIPAAWCYEHWRDVQRETPDTMEALLAALQANDWSRAATFVRNDLEGCARNKFPILEMLAKRMESLGVSHVLMSGSGSTMFGFCNANTAPDVCEILMHDFAGLAHCFRTPEAYRTQEGLP
ncbi:MAG: hypothetical protein IJJ26_13275, partial [Victivallales bacterium]|nr:hypothetical protein [Victivallales bacterium]